MGQATISEICVSKAIGNSWRPCGKKKDKNHSGGEEDDHHEEGRHRRLLSLLESGATPHRVLAAVAVDKCAAKA